VLGFAIWFLCCEDGDICSRMYDVCDVLVQWSSVENRLVVSTTDDVYIISEHVMSLHCCGAVS